MLIQSALITLRKTEKEDLPFVVETEGAPENAAFIGQWTFEEHLEAITNEDKVHLILENKAGSKVGYVILTGLRDANKAVCVKRIANQSKGLGYGKEAMRLVIQWVFENTETHRLWLDVKDFNHRARHVYEAVGFVFEGTLRDSFYNGNGFQSLAVMSILKHEYKGYPNGDSKARV